MNKNRKLVKSPSFQLILGFFLVILFGTIMLSLPISKKDGISLSFIDTLFVSASAVCVTGLTPVVIKDTFSTVGYVILAVLMQIGGLGFAAFAGMVLTMIRRNSVGKLLRESYGASAMQLNRLLATIAIVTLICETIGIVFLFIFFLPYYQPLKAFGYAVFHTISAFNNSGFDLFGTSLVSFSSNIGICLTIAFLIVTGGLGFLVYLDFIESREHHRLSLHTKIVLIITLVLLVVGTVLFYLSGELSLLESFFQSVTARTAGFESVPQASLSGYSRLVTIILMFIGASPGSTGGGIKTTTFFTLLLASNSVIRRKSPTAFHRRISSSSVEKAETVFVVSMGIIVIFTVAIAGIESGKGIMLEDILFEVISAFATVGLSCATTPLLSSASKLLVVLLMFIGRVGPLTVAGLLEQKKETIGYVDETINIG